MSCLSIACAIATLVPTPSVDAASTGSVYLPIFSANSPAKPPMPPSTSGRVAFSAYGRSASTARSPASMSTPAEA